MAKIIVTGGSGFIGSHLVEELLERGNSVTVFDILDPDKALNLKEVITHPNLNYIRGDITNKREVNNAITSETEIIYHLSSIVGVKRYLDNPLKVIEVNVIGTRNVLRAAESRNIKILFTSTSEIYGNNPKVPWAEDASRVLGPTTIDRWSYSSSKAVCEHMVLSMYKYKDLPVSVVRYFNIYGPRQDPILVVSRNIQRILKGEKPILYDGGNQTRCFTFVKDAVDATIKIAESSESNGEIYNVGSDVESTIVELINCMFEVQNIPNEFDIFDTKKEYGASYQDIQRRVPNVGKILHDFNWRAKTSLKEGLTHTFAWSSKNDWWLNLEY